MSRNSLTFASGTPGPDCGFAAFIETSHPLIVLNTALALCTLSSRTPLPPEPPCSMAWNLLPLLLLLLLVPRCPKILKTKRTDAATSSLRKLGNLKFQTLTRIFTLKWAGQHMSQRGDSQCSSGEESLQGVRSSRGRTSCFPIVSIEEFRCSAAPSHLFFFMQERKQAKHRPALPCHCCAQEQ